MPAKKKRRERGQKEPVEKTKYQILLFIADNPYCEIDDIRRYLTTKLNIRNKKVIREYVNYLVSDNLIKKESGRKGKPDKYYIEETFTAFKNTFNYIYDHDQNLSLDFMKTKYTQSIFSKDDFLLYGLINLGLQFIIELINIYIDDNKFNAFISEMSDEEAKIVMELSKEEFTEEKDVLEEEFLPLLNRSPEELIELTEYSLSQNPIVNDSISVMKILNDFVNSIFLPPQKKELINILSTSPSSLKFFLNFEAENKIKFFANFTLFLLKIFNMDDLIKIEKDLQTLNLKIENKENIGNIQAFIEDFKQIISTKNIGNENPLLITLKAYFIIDALSGKIIENEYSKKVLYDILIPKVKK